MFGLSSPRRDGWTREWPIVSAYIQNLIYASLLITGNGIQNTCFLVPILQTYYTFTAYPMSLYFRLLKEYLASKQILRQSETNVTEDRDRPTQTPLLWICLCFRHVTCLLDALLERFDSAHFHLQDILTSQNVRSERTRSEFFSLR